ncbi:MAG: hypothetical protein NC489_31920 [Ruminococcus flavefaciens]|nr:hypothetical protein [Ruminococcus flavefaciens]
MALEKEDIQAISDLIQPIKDELQEVKRKLADVQLHLENGTDKNIQLIAENFIELTKKLNQAIPIADKNLAYEVKVNYLVEKVQTLEKEIDKLKNKIA